LKLDQIALEPIGLNLDTCVGITIYPELNDGHLLSSSGEYSTDFTAFVFSCPAFSADHEELMSVTFFKDIELALAIVTSLNHFVSPL
jgi:hypothetical protein